MSYYSELTEIRGNSIFACELYHFNWRRYNQFNAAGITMSIERWECEYTLNFVPELQKICAFINSPETDKCDLSVDVLINDEVITKVITSAIITGTYNTQLLLTLDSGEIILYENLQIQRLAYIQLEKRFSAVGIDLYPVKNSLEQIRQDCVKKIAAITKSIPKHQDKIYTNYLHSNLNRIPVKNYIQYCATDLNSIDHWPSALEMFDYLSNNSAYNTIIVGYTKNNRMIRGELIEISFTSMGKINTVIKLNNGKNIHCNLIDLLKK